MNKHNHNIPEITVRKAGPIVVRGEFTVKDNDGNHIDLKGAKVISLCGCMKTKNSVFCDGSHNKP